jgi:hypothetical protein
MTTFDTPARSEVRIMQSKVTNIIEGTVLRDGTILDVPANAAIKVLITPSNVTKVIVGPYKGTAADYTGKMLPSAKAKPKEVVEPGMLATSPPPGKR